MMFDTEKLIQEIQKHPSIWNNNLDEYNNKAIKVKAWLEVGNAMYNDWENLKERRLRIQELQRRWKGLRDYFTKNRNKPIPVRCDSPFEKKKRKSYVLDSLQFMNVTSTRPAGSNPAPSNGDNTTDSTSTNPENEMTIKFEVVSEDEQSCSSEARSPQMFEEALVRDPPASLQDDADKHFLLAMLPYMKSMTPQQNFQFRFDVMNLVKRMKYSDD